MEVRFYYTEGGKTTTVVDCVIKYICILLYLKQ